MFDPELLKPFDWNDLHGKDFRVIVSEDEESSVQVVSLYNLETGVWYIIKAGDK